MWKCNNCGYLSERVPENMKCSGCGITLGRTKATNGKYEILEDICRLNDYKLIIDACAGGGKVQLVENGSMIDGSSLRLETLAREKDPEPKRIYIEYETRTYNLLSQLLGSTNSTLINEDCNLNLLNFADGKNPTLVYVDPFGYGIPAIKRDIILELSRTDNIDLLISFSWRITREMGHARRYLYCTFDRCPSPSGMDRKYGSCNKCPTRKRATSYKDSLNIWWGNSDWLQWRTGLKDDEYARRYAEPLRDYNRVKIFPIPRFGKTTYHLIFATKFDILFQKWQ